jgi:DNA-binding CsgD family transcriptional regulator
MGVRFEQVGTGGSVSIDLDALHRLVSALFTPKQWSVHQRRADGLSLSEISRLERIDVSNVLKLLKKINQKRERAGLPRLPTREPKTGRRRTVQLRESVFAQD